MIADLTGVHVDIISVTKSMNVKNFSCLLSVGVGVLLDEEKLTGNAFSCFSWLLKNGQINTTA